LMHTAPAAFGANQPIWPTPLEQKEGTTRLTRKPAPKIEEECVFPSHNARLGGGNQHHTSVTWDHGMSLLRRPFILIELMILTIFLKKH
jgi:hypothetical protein